jgi:hypothetical protein
MMKLQDQNPMEALESRIGESPLGCQESASRSYRAPQVLLVGKAKRLMAGAVYGAVDYEGAGDTVYLDDGSGGGVPIEYV